MAHTPCPFETEACNVREKYGACFADQHHAFFPRFLYRSGLEKEFRELPENKQQLCRAEHDEIHASRVIPEKPSPDEMRLAIQESRARAERLGSIALEEAL